jgi:hypothetical protein
MTSLHMPEDGGGRDRRMREIRTSGGTRGRARVSHGIQLLRHEAETWTRVNAGAYPGHAPSYSTVGGSR